MSVQISRIADAGDLEKERIILRVSSDGDIGQYAMLRAEFEDGSVTTAVTDVFWFPDQGISSGDVVVLYSKSGNSRVRGNKNETRSHFFYWGLDRSIWGTEEHSAVLLRVADWHSYNPQDR